MGVTKGPLAITLIYIHAKHGLADACMCNITTNHCQISNDNARKDSNQAKSKRILQCQCKNDDIERE